MRSSRLAPLGAVALLLSSVVLCGVALAKKSDKPDRSRPAPAQCATQRGSAKLQPRSGSTCKADADCKAPGKNGRCVSVYGGGRVPPKNECTYDGCFVDKDCGAGQACECGHDASVAGETHECVKAECRVDADCGAGAFCSPSYPLCSRGRSLPQYFCHTPKDECMVDSDCPAPTEKGYGPNDTKCAFSPVARRWTCMSEQCPVG